MKWLINIIGKLTGANAIWKKMDGYKTKVSGVIMMLTGLASLLTGAIACTDVASVWVFIQALPANAGWLSFIGGLGILGIGHKSEKLDAVNKIKIEEEIVPTVD